MGAKLRIENAGKDGLHVLPGFGAQQHQAALEILMQPRADMHLALLGALLALPLLTG